MTSLAVGLLTHSRQSSNVPAGAAFNRSAALSLR